MPDARASSSLAVLAALGVLSLMLPTDALAQGAGTVLPKGTLPVVRAIVSRPESVSISTTSSPTSDGRQLTVNQIDKRAIIDWSSFNIGSASEVYFRQRDQGDTSANPKVDPAMVMLNRIYGADPSIIQGRLRADAQVILINRNGILFDRGAQVNVPSLVASTLNLKQGNDQFLKGVALTAGGSTNAAFEGSYDDTGAWVETRPTGTLLIGAEGPVNGAAPRIDAGQGGTIVLVAPRIDNVSGVVTAPDGQVILAAGHKVWLFLPDDTDTTGLRGLKVEVEAPAGEDINLTSLIRNSGSLGADRGNVSLAALAINQNGRVSATTAIQANGTVFLQARSKGNAQAGSVSFAKGSVTEVMPDSADKATLPEGQSYADRRGLVQVEGGTIASEGTVRAAGGLVNLIAAETVSPTEARVYLGANSTTSVAGNWADVAYAENLLTLKVTSNELKDAPDQKNGILKGATVTVDLRTGSPLLNLEGYLAAQGRTVAQKTAVGGDLVIRSSGSLVQRQGATLDASGGGYLYGAGTAATTQLIGEDGRIYDIGSAAQARRYTGFLDRYEQTHPRWGVGASDVYTGLLFNTGRQEAAYAEGKQGGTINLQSAAGLVLDGTLRGGVTVGPNQLNKAPRGAVLTIGNFDGTAGDFAPEQRIGNVTFTQRASDTLGAAFTATTALTGRQVDHITLAAEQLYAPSAAATRGVYQQDAFGAVEINSNGAVDVPADVSIEGAPGSSLAVRSPKIDVSGSIEMPAGAIALRPTTTVNPVGALDASNLGVTVHAGAELSTAGAWVNNAAADGGFVGGALPTARLNRTADGSVVDADGKAVGTRTMLDGGSITIAAPLDSATLLERGATLDVGGGGLLDRNRRLTAGSGGALSISNSLSVNSTSDWLQADLRGGAAGNGGTLELSTNKLVIDADAAGVLPSDTTRVAPSLFADLGFSKVTLNGLLGVTVEAGTTIAAGQTNLVVDTATAAGLPSGSDLATVSTVQRLADDLRHAVSVTLASTGGAVRLAEGAQITGDPKASITLQGAFGLEVEGRIAAAGGNVVLKLNGTPDLSSTPLTLGSKAEVSVAGTFVPKPNAAGLVQGSVVGAGSITIDAVNAGVDLRAGSRLNLDGLTRELEFTTGAAGGAVQRQAVDGNAGTLLVRSQGETTLASTLSARAGSAHGAGGSMAVELNAPNASLGLGDERRITVTQAAAAAGPMAGLVNATVAIDPLAAAGFDRLRLQSENTIAFAGDTDARFARGIRLDAPLIDMLADARVALSGTSVAIGQSLAPRAASGALDDRGVSPAITSREGFGSLAVQADTIDLYGSVAINGAAQTRLASRGDIRLTGRETLLPAVPGQSQTGAQIGSLATAGNVVMSAAQVAPSTRTDYTILVGDRASGTAQPGGSIAIESNGVTPGDVYSAGGKVTLAADAIVQAGVLKAPLGEIALNATSSLELKAGSLTSVAADAPAVPYGITSAGLVWTYKDGVNSNNTLTAPSAVGKQVTFSGARIDVRPGATVDISGGGDVQAAEFVSGSGGSKDTLIQANTYAIIPKSRLAAMPVDADRASRNDPGFGFQVARPDAGVYDSLVIGSGAIVPPGEYVLLPGRYALLPDAYLVTLQLGSAYANMAAGQTLALPNGQTVVAGVRAASGTSVRESRTVGVVVRPGSAATTESDYTLTTSQFFADQAALARTQAPRLPADAGRLVIEDVAALSLGGTFATTAAAITTAATQTAGRQAEVDISAAKIAVVDPSGTAGVDASYLQLDGAQLSKLGGSVLLGGTRTAASDGVTIETGASDVLVANTRAGALTAPEVLLAATGLIEVRSGSVVEGTGASTGAAASVIHSESGGALVRLSSTGQTQVDRGATADSSVGDIRIESGASLVAERSLLLDATHGTRSQGTLKAGGAGGAGGAVSLGSTQVSLGETAGVAGLADGLVLSNADLAGYAALDQLEIKGYQGIDLYGNAALGAATLGSLILDSAAIRGRPGATAGNTASRITATQVEFMRSAAGDAAATAPGSGTLAVDAGRIMLGAGDKTISGFASVAMTASDAVVASGTGATRVAADWTLSTPKVDAAAGSHQVWQAADVRDAANPTYFAMTVGAAPAVVAGAPSTVTPVDAGGRLALEARNVTVGTTIQARSGAIDIAAKGAAAVDGVNLGAGAKLDASGVAKDFRGKVVTVDGGSVTLTAEHGQVAAAAGSTIDVSAAVQGGDAGRLAIRAQGTDLSGTLAGGATAAGARAGDFALDVQRLADFSALNASLESSRFGGARDLRVRSGDITVKAGDTVTAREVQLAADAGRIDIAGTIDASAAAGGGTVWVSAAQGLALAAGSRVLANGMSTDAAQSAALSDGGNVRFATAGGMLAFDAASVIDVRAGAKGSTGSVTLGVTRNDDGTMGATALNGTVRGAAVTDAGGATLRPVVALEATRVVANSSGSVTAADIAAMQANHAAFMATAPSAMVTGVKGDDGAARRDAVVRGATEVRANGDLRLDTAWDLTTADWLAGGQPGTLTLRAGGTLTIAAALGAPNDNIIAGRTWNLRAVGGADLTAANAMATKGVDAGGSGSVVLAGDAARLRTGTGTIDIAAATDFTMTGLRSVVTTTGRIGATDAATNGNNRWAVDGGAISINAGRDAIGASDEWVTEWLRRTRQPATATPVAEWWAYRPNFQQGVGTLGGGDIRITAGGNVDTLSASLPTTGRSVVDVSGKRSVDVQGGGDLWVRAGGDVRGGSYLIGRGTGRIDAGGDLGAGTPTQLLPMGASSGDVPEQATLALQAGGAVTLQSVNNPTTLVMKASQGTGPSFGAGGTAVSTYFTLVPGSSLDVVAKAGDLVLGGNMAPARTQVASQAVSAGDVAVPAVYPASLTAASLAGDLKGEATTPEAPIVTFPSASATVSLLAQGSVNDINFNVSDLLPAQINDTAHPAKGLLTGNDLLKPGNSHLVARDAVDGYVVDVQALDGSVRSTGASAIKIVSPALTRVQAGTDIVNAELRLQNLTDTDVSVLRADHGDIRPSGVEIRGPGRLLVQAGRNVDVGQAAVVSGGNVLGGLIATGKDANPSLKSATSARITVVAGVSGDVDLARLDAAYPVIVALNDRVDDIVAFYRALNSDANAAAVLKADGIDALVARDATYAKYVELATAFPQLLGTYQAAVRAGTLPLGATADAARAAALYALLNSETNVAAITNARSVADLVNGTAGGAAYQAFVALDTQYPRVFADYRLRRGSGSLPTGLTPILFSDALAAEVAKAVPAVSATGGNIDSYLTSIQTYGGSDIDLWAPAGSIVVGLTTPSSNRTVGVLTNAGGAVRSVLSGDFSINQGKVLTAQGGDIMIYTAAGSIDAGRGAKTSISTPPPKRTPIFQTDDAGNPVQIDGENVIIGFAYTIPSSASGSGIQTLTSDPDGLGPRVSPAAGSIALYAPAGTIDAGEAGIRSGGNLSVVGASIKNSSNFASSGTSNVPTVATGSAAASLASSGGNTSAGSKAADDASAAATNAAKAAAAAPVAKPSILTVEVLGFGDRNCKETDKDCFAK